MNKKRKVILRSVLGVASFVVAILLGVYSDLASIWFYVFAIIGILAVVGIEIVDHLKESSLLPDEWKKETINLLLEVSRRIIFGLRNANYRISVMHPDPKNGLLYITHHKGILGVEKAIKIEPGKGCAGIAYKEKRMARADISKYGHQKFGLSDETIKRISPTMKSIISVPLVDMKDYANPEVKGVLSFTTTLDFRESGFEDPDIQERILAFSDTLSNVLYS